MNFLKGKKIKGKINKLCIMMVLFMFCYSVSYAALNIHTEPDTAFSEFFSFIIGRVGTGVLGSVIAPLVNVFSLLLFLILYLLFSRIWSW